MQKHYLLIIAFALIFGAKATAQEWVNAYEVLEYDTPRVKEAKPLQNGNIAVTFHSKSPDSHLGSFHPGLLLLSANGEELARNDFHKPAFWGYRNQVLQDADGTLYMVAAYSPDHDSTSNNYFMNFDNPPDHSILGLYKLDSQLSVVESHEFPVPVDTLRCPEEHETLAGTYNEFCGGIYVFSSFIDDGAVVGGYIKKPSFDYFHPHGNDSIFFFRIGLNGTLLNHVGYEVDKHGEPGGGGVNWEMVLRGYNILKAGDSYICFLNVYYLTGYAKETETEKNLNPGHAYFLDADFNIVDMKHYHQKDGLQFNAFRNASYIRSDHNTVYVSSMYPLRPNGGTGCSLYEYGLGNDRTETLPIVRYIERTASSFDETAFIKGIDVASDNSLFFAYTLNDGRDGLSIEHLTPSFDTISTMFYIVSTNIEDARYNYVRAIEVTESGDLLMVFNSLSSDGLRTWNGIAKFPAEAFVGIDEAHDNGLKMAIAYPNPGKDVLNIRTGLKDARVEVYDLNGRLVHSQALTENITAIDATDWAEGVYVWKVYAGVSTGSTPLAETGKWVKK